MKYDIVVIGNDEAAFEMLNLAAVSGHRTAAVLPELRHSSWLMAQALRRLTSDLLVDRTLSRRRLFARSGSPRLLQSLLSRAIADEVREHMQMLERLDVDVRLGEASFGVDAAGRPVVHCNRRQLSPKYTVLATGVQQTATLRSIGQLPFHSPEAIFAGRRLPSAVQIIGGGDFGIGLAALTSLFGVSTTLLTDESDSSVMLELAESAGVRCAGHLVMDRSSQDVSGAAANVVDCRRQIGFTEHLNLSAVEIEPDENGRLWCGDSLETWRSGIFGIGDVVGFCSDSDLSTTEQAGRILDRIQRSLPRPHLLKAFAEVEARTAS
ncbi:MAG: hypothetical protein Fues2KO_31310 [Fuerstiella sp.]